MIAARTIIKAFLLLALLQAAPAGAGLLSAYPLDAASMEQWRLPERLKEISGLALDADERLFAIADEEAVIYELDVDEGRLLKAFAWGDPVLRGDFEGIAIVGEDFYLVTSDGEIVAGREGIDGEQGSYRRYPTGLGRRCEVEGLAADPARDRLLLVCKEARRRGTPAMLEIHAWSLTGRYLLPEPAIQVNWRGLLPRIGADRLNPSGLLVDAATGNILVIASRQRALVELTADGELVQALRLPLANRHRQPEGIERLADGRLVIADEGGSHKARLAVYRRHRGKE